VNRLEATQQVLLLEAAAAQLRERAKAVRLELDADARHEFEEQGAAPTWRLADLGTWSLPVSKEAAYVADEAEFLDWLKRFHPTEVETVERVRPAFLSRMLPECSGEDGDVVWMREGALVPGLAIRPGGLALSLRFKPNSDAMAVADQAGAKLAGQLLDGLGIATGGAPDA
jgi:hypothetical protein